MWQNAGVQLMHLMTLFLECLKGRTALKTWKKRSSFVFVEALNVTDWSS